MRGLLPILLWLAAVCQAEQRVPKPVPKPRRFEPLGENIEADMKTRFSWWCMQLMGQCLDPRRMNLRSEMPYLNDEFEAQIAVDFDEPFDRDAECGSLVTKHIQFQLANIISQVEVYLQHNTPRFDRKRLNVKRNAKYARNQLKHSGDYQCTEQRAGELYKNWLTTQAPSAETEPAPGAVAREPEREQSNVFFGRSPQADRPAQAQSTPAPGLCEKFTSRVTLGLPSEATVRRFCNPKTNPIIQSSPFTPDNMKRYFGGGSSGVAPRGRVVPLRPIGRR